MIRLILSYVIALLLVVMVNGCKKDNYEKPSSILTGKVVYDKEAVGLRSNGVQLELWQHGFELFTKIPVYVAQDGTFSASLFNGTYKLVRLPGNGPWVNNIDSIDVTVNGNTVVEVPVQPYFVIKNTTISKSGTTVTGTFSIGKIANGGTLESVALFVGKTNIVDAVNNLGSVAINGSDITDINAPVTVSLTIPGSLSGQSFFFARVSVKTAGVAEHIYSQPIKIE